MTIRGVTLGCPETVHHLGCTGKAMRLLTFMRHDRRLLFLLIGRDIDIKLRHEPDPHQRISEQDRAAERRDIRQQVR